MRSEELIPGTLYRTTARELPKVRFMEVLEDFGNGMALIHVVGNGRLYIMAADQMIAEEKTEGSATYETKPVGVLLQP